VAKAVGGGPPKLQRDSPQTTRTPHCAGSRRADERIRTADPFITSEVLYQLSYVGEDPATVDLTPPLRRSARGAVRHGKTAVASVAPMSSPAGLEFYDVELRAHHDHLRAAYGVGPGDEVLDIGCGAGLTTREVARAAAPGRVVGVDVSEPMLQRARQLTAAERLDNVRYELGDAQVHRFEPRSFDVAISRFGTMFFSDPAVAFANIAAALRPRARLVLLVWQRDEDNEWPQAIRAALGDAARPPRREPDAFSLGDAEATTRILEQAGFDGVRLEDVHEPVLYGRDLDAALAFVQGFQNISAALATLSDSEAAKAVGRLRNMLEAHYDDERGVVLDARSWLITARRRAARTN
jgi:SAM-dependent methyltransferase